MRFYLIQHFYEGQWLSHRACPEGMNSEEARDMLEESRTKIKKRELRLVEVIPPPYVAPEIRVLDA